MTYRYTSWVSCPMLSLSVPWMLILDSRLQTKHARTMRYCVKTHSVRWLTRMAIGNTRWIESMDKRRKEAKLRGGTAMAYCLLACLGSWHSQRCDPAVAAHDAVPTPVAGVARRGPARRGVRPFALERVESRTCENKLFQFRIQKEHSRERLVG